MQWMKYCAGWMKIASRSTVIIHSQNLSPILFLLSFFIFIYF